ncbi:GNAT family N-acetyltransferase [Streptococcus halotolerans]|uniref:GNAT family N-acetyltransferase n=1 Tax=Streptococcus halotolerans TaxID=1814128 RepID=UPI000786DCEE|nr:GNAT family N-acetyltransferase [Streptococcus halotolerans]
MTDLALIKPSIDYLETIAAYKNEFAQANEHLYGGAHLENDVDLGAWIAYTQAIETESGVKEGQAPSSTFLCVRQADQKMVGICNIRHHLKQDSLIHFVGHIGYSICPSERRKGYAKEQLKLALKEAYKLGITKVLVTCDADNLASEKTILANGGVYDNTYVDPDDYSQTKRFWIEVNHGDKP